MNWKNSTNNWHWPKLKWFFTFCARCAPKFTIELNYLSVNVNMPYMTFNWICIVLCCVFLFADKIDRFFVPMYTVIWLYFVLSVFFFICSNVFVIDLKRFYLFTIAFVYRVLLWLSWLIEMCFGSFQTNHTQQSHISKRSADTRVIAKWMQTSNAYV